MPDMLLLRHAPTDWNRDGRMQGKADIPLSEAGRRDAEGWCLPAFAKGWACRSSPLGRAMQTATIMNLSPVPDAAFVEMDWGDFEGRTLDELRAAQGEALAANERRGLDFRPDNGESPREVANRALDGLGALREDTVVVTHKGVIRALLALALGWDMTGKAPIRLLPGTAHRFRLDPGLSLVQANIPLHKGDPT